MLGQVKLANFGWAVHSPSSRCTTACGRLDYLAPELLNSEVHNEKIDVWALGAISYEFLVGKPHFFEEYSQDTCRRIKSIYRRDLLSFSSHTASNTLLATDF